MPAPEIHRTGAAIHAAVETARREGQTVGLVPTMGALHEGHLSLVRAARAECDRVVATVFVNPTQFSADDDLDRYPRDLHSDRRLLGEAGCDLLFAPSVEEMYPPGCTTFIDVGSVAEPLEGVQRPTHFRGVATIVMKLFHLAPADRAYFGQKDYQQTVVLRQMVRDLNVPIEIRICPLIRDTDGLALSSRNARLSPAERKRALALSQSLHQVKKMVTDERITDTSVLQTTIEQMLAAEGLQADYIAFLKQGTVQPVEVIAGPTVIALAVPLGDVRLLDNTRIDIF